MSAHRDHVWAGMACAAAAVAALALQSLAAKVLAGLGHHPVEIAAWRCGLALVPFGAWILASGRVALLRPRRPGLLAARVAIGITGLWCILGAFARMPLADVTVLLFSAVLMAPALSALILRERVGPRRWAAIGVGFVGVLIAAQPTGAFDPLGVALALAGALGVASVRTMLRALKAEPVLGTTFYFLLGGVVLSAPALPFVAHAPGPEAWPWLALIGAAGLGAQLLLTLSGRLAPVAATVPFDYTGLLWAAAFDLVFWHIAPGWPVLAGGAVIAASHAYILHRERARALASVRLSPDDMRDV